MERRFWTLNLIYPNSTNSKSHVMAGRIMYKVIPELLITDLEKLRMEIK